MERIEASRVEVFGLTGVLKLQSRKMRMVLRDLLKLCFPFTEIAPGTMKRVFGFSAFYASGNKVRYHVMAKSSHNICPLSLLPLQFGEKDARFFLGTKTLSPLFPFRKGLTKNHRYSFFVVVVVVVIRNLMVIVTVKMGPDAALVDDIHWRSSSR